MAVQKVQKSGKSYYLYLPQKWIDDNLLTKGSEVNVDPFLNNIVVSVSSTNKNSVRKISLMINTLEPEIITDMISHLFVAGYDEFELKFQSELNEETVKLIKNTIKDLGLNMMDLTQRSVKLYMSMSVNDIRKFARDSIYKALNFIRMLTGKEKKALLEEVVTSLYSFMFITLRSLTRYQQGLCQLNIKPYETRFYNTLASDLPHLLIHLMDIKDDKYIAEVKKVFEKLLVIFDKPDLTSIIELKRIILKLYPDKTTDEESYHKTRVGRFLREIVHTFTIGFLVGLETKED